MVDEKLPASAKQVGERRSPVIGVEPVFLVDPHPGQLLAPPRQLVAASRVFLLRFDADIEPTTDTDTVRARDESAGPSRRRRGLLSMGLLSRADRELHVFLESGYVGSVRGRPKPANTPRSTNHVIAEIRSPSSVSTINPYERAIAARASGT